MARGYLLVSSVRSNLDDIPHHRFCHGGVNVIAILAIKMNGDVYTQNLSDIII